MKGLKVACLVVPCTALLFVSAMVADEVNLSSSGTPVAFIMGPLGGGNRDINVIHDGVKPDPVVGENAGDSLQQYDTVTGVTRTEDWIGYEFPCTYDFTRLVFQEGKHFFDGGYFEPPESLIVQVKDPSTGEWAEAPGTWDPPYQGRYTNGEIVDFETFTWTPDSTPVTGNGLRIYGIAGGTATFISCAEIEVYTDVTGVGPVISLTYSPSEGPAPLVIDFDASASTGDSISFAWDFGDGETAVDAKVTHTFASTGKYTVKLLVSSDQGGCAVVAQKIVTIFAGNGLAAFGRPICSVMAPAGGGNHDLDVIRDGIKPATVIGLGAGNSFLQYDTWDGANVVLEEWIGYEFDAPYTFASVVFQEGNHFDDGGYFSPPESMVVQVKDEGTGEWVEVPGSWDPPYTGLTTNNQIIDFETFTWTADEPVESTGIRVYGQPGGAAAFISCAELEVAIPPLADVVRKVEKETFLPGETITVSLDIVLKSNDPLSLDEVMPDGAMLMEVSDNGILTGSTIHWDISEVATTITYMFTFPPCATELKFGKSSWRDGLSMGGVTGVAALTLDLKDQSLGTWSVTDITAPGSASLLLGPHDLLVQGAGAGIRAGIKKDGFRFIHQPAAGDFEISARVDCIAGSGVAGLMARDTLDEASAHAIFYVAPSSVSGVVGSLSAMFRKATGVNAMNSSLTITSKDVTAFPVWLQLRRGVDTDGKTYLFFERSDDGSSYIGVGKKEVSATGVDLKDSVFLGLAAAGVSTGPVTATFGAVTGPEFSGGEQPLEAPTALAATGGKNQVTLTWAAPAGGPAPESYVIYKASAPLDTVPATTMTYTQNGLEDDTQHCYTVTSSKIGAAESPPTAEACGQTDPKESGTKFRRGDSNTDGAINLTDAVYLLGFLFLGDPQSLACKDAADANDDGVLNLTDAVFSLGWMFLGTNTLPLPGDKCGVDPTTPQPCTYSCP